mmetsp:Transcript_21900/g.58902  ORF Transcript_21900/g.58902 Transcript_21900/m.58902 type:complete len:222 (-) Transcript_21900:430-1095(-)
MSWSVSATRSEMFTLRCCEYSISSPWTGCARRSARLAIGGRSCLYCGRSAAPARSSTRSRNCSARSAAHTTALSRTSSAFRMGGAAAGSTGSSAPRLAAARASSSDACSATYAFSTCSVSRNPSSSAGSQRAASTASTPTSAPVCGSTQRSGMSGDAPNRTGSSPARRASRKAVGAFGLGSSAPASGGVTARPACSGGRRVLYDGPPPEPARQRRGRPLLL